MGHIDIFFGRMDNSLVEFCSLFALQTHYHDLSTFWKKFKYIPCFKFQALLMVSLKRDRLFERALTKTINMLFFSLV